MKRIFFGEQINGIGLGDNEEEVKETLGEPALRLENPEGSSVYYRYSNDAVNTMLVQIVLLGAPNDMNVGSRPSDH